MLLPLVGVDALRHRAIPVLIVRVEAGPDLAFFLLARGASVRAAEDVLRLDGGDVALIPRHLVRVACVLLRLPNRHLLVLLGLLRLSHRRRSVPRVTRHALAHRWLLVHHLAPPFAFKFALDLNY